MARAHMNTIKIKPNPMTVAVTETPIETTRLYTPTKHNIAAFSTKF